MLPNIDAVLSTGNVQGNSKAHLVLGFFPSSSSGRSVNGLRPAVGVSGGFSHAASTSYANSQPRPIPRARVAGSTVLEAPTADTRIPDVIDLGYAKDLHEKYILGKELGKGGNGLVTVAASRETGEEFACKAIKKVLDGDFSEQKKAGHVEGIKREVEVLRRLAGSLNIIKLVDVFEDEANVYLVQELCRGGELWHRIGERHYSERTVASFMRAVLRTLAQCHSHRILHRDIKPGNFMLLDDSERAPLKAIDFGLAVPFDPDNLPRRDLGFEGTPWYMAPEVLSSQVTPASDIWSAGVMAFQLLTGRLPFDDHRNPFAPSISAVWRSVLSDNVDFNMPWWKGISDDAKDFVHMLLTRDPSKRPTAKEALKHPWLQGNSSERSTGKQIDVSVVARIQRFAQNNRFKRSVLRMIAEELLARPGAAAAEASLAADASASVPDKRYEIFGSPNSGNPIIHDPNSQPMQEIYDSMQLKHDDVVDRECAAVAMANMGYKLDQTEINRLLELMDISNSGKVRRAAVAASQLDWRHLQQRRMDDWLEIARRAFMTLDKDSDGKLAVDDILASLKAKLAPDELRLTVQQAMADAGHAHDADHMDFEGFLRMLRVGSIDSLDQYDARWDRLAASPAVDSIDRLQAMLDASMHGSDNGSSHGTSRARGLYAGLHNVAPAGPAAPHNSDQHRDKSWQKPMVNFRFDFGNEFIGHKMGVAGQQAAGAPRGAAQSHLQRPGPPETRGAPEGATDAAGAALPKQGMVATVPGSGNINASSYVNTGAVRAGIQFDKQMHGAGLYHNAVLNAGMAKPVLHKLHPLSIMKE